MINAELQQSYRKPLDMRFGESPIDPQTPLELVASDLYRTFWYAQGEFVLHDYFAELAVGEYARTWSDADWQACRGHIGDPEDEAFQKFGLPRRHIDPRADNTKDYADTIQEEFALRWRAAGEAFDQTRAEVAVQTEVARVATLSDLETRMVYRDYQYNTGRTRRFSTNDNSDPHESMYRTFVLEGRPTGSETFDAIFAALRQRFIEKGPPDPIKIGEKKGEGYPELVAAWQINHPNETFEPSGDDIQLGLSRGEARSRVSALSLGGLGAAIKRLRGRPKS